MPLPTDEVKKTLTQHILGPRGGLFALGCFVGMGAMYYFMSATLIAEIRTSHTSQITAINAAHTAQVTSLEARVTTLETENKRIRERLEEIAFDDMEK